VEVNERGNKMTYQDFTNRNKILINPQVQDSISKMKVLLCGCGIGSYLAEAVLRMGCLDLTLVDMDTVSETNLNRQNYEVSDVGMPKVFGLAKRLKAIYPNATITPVNEFLDSSNADELVKNADVILDTIDYLDMGAILLLHERAKVHKKHILSAMSIGFGAGFFYFSPAHEYSFRDHIEAKTGRPISEMNYAEAFQVVLASLLPVLNEEVKVVLEGVIEQMAKKQPCPASQVSVGGMCCAALTATALEHIARGEALTPFPQFYYLDLHQLIRQKQGTVIF
jgi:molybdopterin/thiamine biosynthesis adenylyltransferase